MPSENPIDDSTACSPPRIVVVGSVDEIPHDIKARSDVVIVDQRIGGNPWSISMIQALRFSREIAASWPEIQPTDPPKKPLCAPPKETIQQMKRRRKRLAKRRG